MASPSGPGDRLDSRAVARVLGLSRGQVYWLAAEGRLSRVVEGRRHLFYRASVEEEVARREAESGRRVSYATAVEIVGCTRGAIAAAVSRGEITRRLPAGKRDLRACLDVESVRSFGERWMAHLREVAERADERAAEADARRALKEPPDDGQVWLSVSVAARVLDLSPVRIRQLAQEDRLPHRRVGRRIWLRRSDVEQIAAARVFRHRQRAAQQGES